MSGWIIALAVFLLLDLILVVWVLVRRRKWRRFNEKEVVYIRAHWVRIIDSFNAYPGRAIMDADKLLDYALGKKCFEGNLGEKLKKAGARFADLDGVWFAHKLRNKVAHELKEVDLEEAKRALKYFKKALNDLGAQL